MLEAPQLLPVVYNADSQATNITRYANLTHSGTTGKVIATTLVYDSMNRLTSKITPQARRLRRRGPVEVTPLYHQTNNFTCDHDGQLLTTTASAMPAENLAFDPSGNRNSAGYTPYDDNGSMTTDDQGHLLVYDAWNRLVAVENSDGTLIKAYTYDGLGRRITESTLNEDATLNTTDIYFSAGGQILEEYQGSAATERNIFSPIYVNATLLRDNGTSLGTRVTFTSDANFNVAGVFSIPGTTLQHQVYSGYGEITWTDASWNSTGSDGYPLENLFQSMHYDATIGWYVTPNCLYRAPLAYWNRVDPAQADGLNWYVPFADNPINGVDPSGLWTIKRDRHKLAIAEPGPDDTIRTLASTLKLNPDEYHKWLTVATPEAYSQNPEKDDGIHIGLDDKVTGNGKCKYQTFLVPNLIVIDYGTSGDWKTKWTGADQAFSIWYYLEQLGEQLKDTFGAQKYMVQENFGADNAAIVGHLTNDTEDKSLYGYFFFGHGGDGSINTGGSQEVSDGEYTTYGIAMMGLYSCESNLPGPGESENQWKYNVSPTGVIRTSPVDLTRLNLPDKVMVTTNGAVKP